jgi:hypothetical protein
MAQTAPRCKAPFFRGAYCRKSAHLAAHITAKRAPCGATNLPHPMNELIFINDKRATVNAVC